MTTTNATAITAITISPFWRPPARAAWLRAWISRSWSYCGIRIFWACSMNASGVWSIESRRSTHTRSSIGDIPRCATSTRASLTDSALLSGSSTWASRGSGFWARSLSAWLRVCCPCESRLIRLIMNGIRARSSSSLRCAALALSHQGTPKRPTAPSPRITTGVPISVPITRPSPAAPSRIASQTRRLQPNPLATYRSRSSNGSSRLSARPRSHLGRNPLATSSTTSPRAISSRISVKKSKGLTARPSPRPRPAGGRPPTGARSYRGDPGQVGGQLVGQPRGEVAEQRDLADQPSLRAQRVHPSPVADPVPHGHDPSHLPAAAALAQVDSDVEGLVDTAQGHALGVGAAHEVGRHHHVLRRPSDRLLGVVGMERDHGAVVPGRGGEADIRHRGISRLAQDDPIRAEPEGELDQVPHGDAGLPPQHRLHRVHALDVGVPGETIPPIVLQVQLGAVLEDGQLLVPGDGPGEHAQEGGLAAPCPSRDDDVGLPQHAGEEELGHPPGHGALADIVLERPDPGRALDPDGGEEARGPRDGWGLQEGQADEAADVDLRRRPPLAQHLLSGGAGQRDHLLLEEVQPGLVAPKGVPLRAQLHLEVGPLDHPRVPAIDVDLLDPLLKVEEAGEREERGGEHHRPPDHPLPEARVVGDVVGHGLVDPELDRSLQRLVDQVVDGVEQPLLLAHRGGDVVEPTVALQVTGQGAADLVELGVDIGPGLDRQGPVPELGRKVEGCGRHRGPHRARPPKAARTWARTGSACSASLSSRTRAGIDSGRPESSARWARPGSQGSVAARATSGSCRRSTSRTCLRSWPRRLSASSSSVLGGCADRSASTARAIMGGSSRSTVNTRWAIEATAVTD